MWFSKNCSKSTSYQSRNIKNMSSAFWDVSQGSSAMLSPMSLDASYFSQRHRRLFKALNSLRLQLALLHSHQSSPSSRYTTSKPRSLVSTFYISMSSSGPKYGAAPIRSYACPLTSIADSRTTGQPNSIIGTFQETVCLAGSH